MSSGLKLQHWLSANVLQINNTSKYNEHKDKYTTNYI